MYKKESVFPSVIRLTESSIDFFFFLKKMNIVNNQIIPQLPEPLGTKSWECVSAVHVSMCTYIYCLFLSPSLSFSHTHTRKLLFLIEISKFLQLLFTGSLAFFIQPPIPNRCTVTGALSSRACGPPFEKQGKWR